MDCQNLAIAEDADTNADDLAYLDVVDKHSRAIYGYAVELTGNRTVAEDILQETLLRAWRHRAILTNGRGSVRGWLLTVARNLAIDAARTRRAYPVGDGGWDTIQRPTGDHAQSVVDTSVLVPAIRKLTVEHRDVLFELYYRRSSVAEAAERFGIPPGTVKSRAHYALRALRQHLGATQPG